VGLDLTLLVFHLADRAAAFPVESAQQVTSMVQLARPPGLPSVLEGILNLAGTAVPVLRLNRLLQLPEQDPGLYSMLIVLKGVSSGLTAVLVDRVTEILSVSEDAVLPVGEENSFHACATGAVSVRGQLIHVLSPHRMLLEKEQQILAGFQALADRRVQEWEAVRP
jgi:purine-binding chemotaxis protein CheW